MAAKARHVDANGNLAVIKTSAGLTARVLASAREKFQGFIDEIEGYGYRIKAIGCYIRRGHMPGSKHYSGRACDIDQAKRDVTSPTMRGVSDIAAKYGLVDGCTWQTIKGERFTGPDCGHIELPGPNGTTYSAKKRKRK